MARSNDCGEVRYAAKGHAEGRSANLLTVHSAVASPVRDRQNEITRKGSSLGGEHRKWALHKSRLFRLARHRFWDVKDPQGAHLFKPPTC